MNLKRKEKVYRF